MVAIPALVETLVSTPLNALMAIQPQAGRARRKRLYRSATHFHHAALAMHLHWAACELGTEGPWVWANGNPHPGAFTTIAVGPRRREEPPATSYDLSEADDEHPAPWHWDLLRCLGGLGVYWKGKASALHQLSIAALDRYREVMLRAAEGDADHGGRIFVQDLPAHVVTALEHDGDADSETRWQRLHIDTGRSPRLRRDAALIDDPSAKTVLDFVQQWLIARGTTMQAIDTVRRAPCGISAIESPRFLVLCRESTALRCLDVAPRQPSALARLLSDHPFATSLACPLTFTVPIGRDPWHQVVPLSSSKNPHLIRTRCHTRNPINPARGTQADRHHLVKLWATLLANAHLRGLACLGANVAATAIDIAADVVMRRDTIASLSADMPQRNVHAWTAFRHHADAHQHASA